MATKVISLKQALNKAYRLIKPKRPEMEVFKKNLGCNGLQTIRFKIEIIEGTK